MPKFYVELKRTVYYGSEVIAETTDAAQDAVIMQAGADPRDWEIIRTEVIESSKHDASDGTRIEIL